MSKSKKWFEKIFGKKKSVQRGFVVGFIIAILIVEVLSLVGLKIFDNKKVYNELIEVSLDSEEKVKELFLFLLKMVGLGLFNIIFIGATIMNAMSKKLLKPIEKLTEATQKVSSGDFSVRLETIREDEIGNLTNNFNKMVTDLESTERLQKEFIDNVSHEIKTPITSIQGFAKLLEDDNLTKQERKEYIDIINEESDRLLNMTTKMLKLSKLQNQSRITNKEQIDVEEQIRKTISLLEPKWSKKEIVFNVSLEQKYFYGDEELIFQVWVNLIDNAIKFSKQKGKINISLKERNNVIEFKIKDSGIGMTEEEQKKIFTRFYQIDKSHSEQGSGLGLAIVKRIIELSDGEIEVKSKQNVGTTIIIRLPLEKEKKKVLTV